MESAQSDRARIVDRTAWWLRSDMALRDSTDPPVPGPLQARGRCDLHATGHARSATHARVAGFLLATASAVALLFGARPASAGPADPGHPVATVVGAGLGVLGVAGFAAGRFLEQRTRYHVWLQIEARAVTTNDVQGLLDAVDEVRDRDDRTWTPDQTWLVAPAIADSALTLARDHGVRCFVRQNNTTREV